VAESVRCTADSRMLVAVEGPLSRSSVVDGIDKLAADFVGIDDRAVRIVE